MIITCFIYIYLGPPLDLDYYSNLKFDEKELDLDMDNKDPITLAGLFEGDIDGVTAQDIQECIIMRLLNTKLFQSFMGYPFRHNGELNLFFAACS